MTAVRHYYTSHLKHQGESQGVKTTDYIQWTQESDMTQNTCWIIYQMIFTWFVRKAGENRTPQVCCFYSESHVNGAQNPLSLSPQELLCIHSCKHIPNHSPNANYQPNDCCPLRNQCQIISKTTGGYFIL